MTITMTITMMMMMMKMMMMTSKDHGMESGTLGRETAKVDCQVFAPRNSRVVNFP